MEHPLFPEAPPTILYSEIQLALESDEYKTGKFAVYVEDRGNERQLALLSLEVVEKIFISEYDSELGDNSSFVSAYRAILKDGKHPLIHRHRYGFTIDPVEAWEKNQGKN